MSMFDLAELGDDDVRNALFDALVERFEGKAREDPSIALVNRMPTVFAVSRRGNLLTLAQGLGLWLLRGDLKSKDRHERLRTFTVGRATIPSRLAITPDRIEGTPDEIVDGIVTMFLEWTSTAAERRPPVSAPAPESRPTARASQKRPTPDDGSRERRATPAGSSGARQPTPPPVAPESPPAPVPVSPPASSDVTKGRPAPTFRTYQLLFDTAWRDLEQAIAQQAGNRHFLISAGVLVALTAEAFFNDLGSRVISSWSQLQRLDPREKAEVLSIELFNDKVDWNVRPFQSIAAALGFRQALAQAQAETLSFDHVGTGDGKHSEKTRTRRTAWQEHCDVVTIQRWINDVRLVIEHFSKGHDPSEAVAGMMEQPSAGRSGDASAREKPRPGDGR